MTHYPPDHHETDMERADREHDERLEARDKHDAYTPRCRTIGCDWPATKRLWRNAWRNPRVDEVRDRLGAKLGQEWLEKFDALPDPSLALPQIERGRLGSGSVAERYFRGELALHLHGAEAAEGENAEPRYWCARFKPCRAVDQGDDFEGSATGEVDHAPNRRVVHARDDGAGGELSVFVFLREFLEDSGGVRFRIAASTVRLQYLDQVNGIGVDASQRVFPVRGGEATLQAGVSDRECVVLPGGNPAVGEDKGSDQVFEHRVNLVDGSPCEHAESGRGVGSLADPSDFPLSVSPELALDLVRLAVEPTLKFKVEPIQFVACATELRAETG